MSHSLLNTDQIFRGAYKDAQQALQMLPVSGLIPGAWDYLTLTPASTTDTYVLKSGGSGGTTVCTITITYTDSTKATISTVART